MSVLRLFKPGKNLMCTSLRKYAINVYKNCSHGCSYCYRKAFSYKAHEKSFIDKLKEFFGLERMEKAEPRYNILKKLEREVKIKEKLPVYLSPATDPYCKEEKEYRFTRKVIQILSSNSFPLMVTTKSDLVLRDLDILKDSKCVVSFSITTLDRKKAMIVEKYAPHPEKRLEALQELSELGIPTVMRIQPIIPFFNDDEEGLEELVKEGLYAGAKHFTFGTLKLVNEAWRRMRRKLPRETIPKLEKVYFERPDRRWKYYYAEESVRLEIVKRLVKLFKKHKVKSFGECREGLGFITTSCDGQHLIVGL